MVPGVPCVMTAGPSRRQGWPVGPWASPEPRWRSLRPSLVPAPDPSGWTTCSVMVASTSFSSVTMEALGLTTAAIWRMRGWNVPVRRGRS